MRIGLIFFPPFTKIQQAEVSFNKVVSADPKEIDNNSSGSKKLILDATGPKEVKARDITPVNGVEY